MIGGPTDHFGAIWRPSPNFGPRRDCIRPWLLVLHYTGMETGEAAEHWLCVEESQVSSHYLVHEDGRIVQMVREVDRAWHAGQSSWHGVADINSASIGIEIANGGHAFGLPPFSDVQIEAVTRLGRDICARWAIEPHNIVAHSDIAPGRKIDPGERFPWQQLAAQGLGLYPRPVTDRGVGAHLDTDSPPEAIALFQKQLKSYGYAVEPTGVIDAKTRTVVAEFQRHFRPAHVDGIIDPQTQAVLADLLEQAGIPASV